MIALSLLFGIGLAWTTLRTTSSDLDASPEPLTQAPEASHSSDASPRRLHYPLEHECIGGLTREEKADKESITLLTVRRHHVTTRDCPVKDDKAVCLKKKYRGYIVFYLAGVFYMFVSLAIVCDEFFVPALESFVDEFGISMDVAGATFMAAGGSMPELFTSFIATFQESDVGFAAIVGSAVFNVLFVIAVCAIASEEVLALTWWPLARDCSCYVIALLTVALFFRGPSKNKIEWWEATILLCEYLTYCVIMKFNGRVYDWLMSKFSKNPPMMAREGEDDHPQAHLFKPSQFRKGIVQLLMQNAFVYETAGIAAVTHVKGNLEETFRKIDRDNDGVLSIEEIQQLLEDLGCNYNSMAVSTAMRRITRTSNGQVDFETFQKWYISSEMRVQMEVRRIFDKIDKDGNQVIRKNEIADLLKGLGHSVNKTSVDKAIAEILHCGPVNMEDPGDAGTGEAAAAGPSEPDADPIITFEQFEKWYSQSLFWQGKKGQHEAAAESGDGGLTLDPPENPSWSAICWYVLSYPICAILYCTLPDVRTPRWQRNWKMAVCEFTLSLFWIAVFSNFLYEWTVVCSNTMGIPPPVAAVTVLAAGTSIPDLLSSYIVAKQGEGDMAVSSSIGSNIFDVTVGLPLPWLMYNIVHNKPVLVKSDSLFFSLLVLVAMLIAVISVVMYMDWKMTKTLGYIMLSLYVIFVVQDLLNQFEVINPNF